jgi:hypothetical protein
MDILQSYQRNIPEQKDQKEKDQTGKDEQSDKDPLLGSGLQGTLQCQMSKSKVQINVKCQNPN